MQLEQFLKIQLLSLDLNTFISPSIWELQDNALLWSDH